MLSNIPQGRKDNILHWQISEIYTTLIKQSVTNIRCLRFPAYFRKLAFARRYPVRDYGRVRLSIQQFQLMDHWSYSCEK